MGPQSLIITATVLAAMQGGAITIAEHESKPIGGLVKSCAFDPENNLQLATDIGGCWGEISLRLSLADKAYVKDGKLIVTLKDRTYTLMPKQES